MKRTLYNLPAKTADSTTALVIPCTMAARRVLLAEDDGAAAQGIVLYFPDDNYTQGYTYAAGHEPVALGHDLAKGKGAGPILGWPLQKDKGGTVTLKAADTYVKACSATATATKLRVEEYA